MSQLLTQTKNVKTVDTNKKCHNCWHKQKMSQLLTQIKNVTTVDTNKKCHNCWHKQKMSQLLTQTKNEEEKHSETWLNQTHLGHLFIIDKCSA
jgi:hypothetical protein